MRTIVPKWKLVTIIRLVLYALISYLVWDTAHNTLFLKSKERQTTHLETKSFAEEHATSTTSMYDVTTSNDLDDYEDDDLSDSDYGMVNGEGINNIVAWRELEESKDYILASQYRHFSNVFEIPEWNYLKNFKNPCWHEKLTDNSVGTIRCFPYVFLAGVEKCGTTDLYNSLILHDMIEAGIIKEPHYWSKRRLKHKSQISSYLSNFYSASKRILQYVNKTTTGYYHPKITLDGSADTFLFNYIWRTFGEKMLDPVFSRTVLTPYHIKHILPTSKFVIILRNPVDRLYSSYNFFPLSIKNPRLYRNVSRKEVAKEMYATKSPQDFHNKVVDALRWFKNCTNYYRNSQKCLYWTQGEELIDYFISHLQMGFYGVTLKRWLDVFPMEQFKIVRLEDYSVDTVSVLNDIFNFLGLDAITPNRAHETGYNRVLNLGKRRMWHGPMLPETRELLSQFYKPYNQMLADLLNDSRFGYSV